MSSNRVVGYVSGMTVGVDREGVFYRFHIVTPTGMDYRVRMRIPPSWMVVGTPITGVLVKASPSCEDYLLQDASQYMGAAESRAQGFENISLDYGRNHSGILAILTGYSAGSVVSAPILSKAVLAKAEKVAGGAGYVYFGESHVGKVVVGVQTVKEHLVGKRMRRLLESLGE